MATAKKMVPAKKASAKKVVSKTIPRKSVHPVAVSGAALTPQVIKAIEVLLAQGGSAVVSFDGVRFTVGRYDPLVMPIVRASKKTASASPGKKGDWPGPRIKASAKKA